MVYKFYAHVVFFQKYKLYQEYIAVIFGARNKI